MCTLRGFRRLRMESRWLSTLTKVLSSAITMSVVTRGASSSTLLLVPSLWKVSLFQRSSSWNKYSPSIKNKLLRLNLNRSWDTRQMLEKEFWNIEKTTLKTQTKRAPTSRSTSMRIQLRTQVRLKPILEMGCSHLLTWRSFWSIKLKKYKHNSLVSLLI